jgi:hypothetical protein
VKPSFLLLPLRLPSLSFLQNLSLLLSTSVDGTKIELCTYVLSSRRNSNIEDVSCKQQL